MRLCTPTAQRSFTTTIWYPALHRGRAKPPETVEEFRSLTAQHLEGFCFDIPCANSYLAGILYASKVKVFSTIGLMGCAMIHARDQGRINEGVYYRMVPRRAQGCARA